MKAQKEEEGSVRAFRKDFKEIRVDGGCWGGYKGTVYEEVGVRDADYGHVHTAASLILKHLFFFLTTKNIFSQLSVDVVYVMVLWRRLSPRVLRN